MGRKDLFFLCVCSLLINFLVFCMYVPWEGKKCYNLLSLKIISWYKTINNESKKIIQEYWGILFVQPHFIWWSDPHSHIHKVSVMVTIAIDHQIEYVNNNSCINDDTSTLPYDANPNKMGIEMETITKSN